MLFVSKLCRNNLDLTVFGDIFLFIWKYYNTGDLRLWCFLCSFIYLKIGIHANGSSRFCPRKFLVTLRFFSVCEDQWGTYFTDLSKCWKFREKNNICKIWGTKWNISVCHLGHQTSISAWPGLLQCGWARLSLLVISCHLVVTCGLLHCALSLSALAALCSACVEKQHCQASGFQEKFQNQFCSLFINSSMDYQIFVSDPQREWVLLSFLKRMEKVLEMSDLGSAPLWILVSGKTQIWSWKVRLFQVLQIKLFMLGKTISSPTDLKQ